MPYADTDMMQLHLNEISRNVTEGAHAVLLLDDRQARRARKYTPIFLPSRAPELNQSRTSGNISARTGFSNTVFENYDAIVDAACDAWRKLIAHPERITSIGMRKWANIGQPS